MESSDLEEGSIYCGGRREAVLGCESTGSWDAGSARLPGCTGWDARTGAAGSVCGVVTGCDFRTSGNDREDCADRGWAGASWDRVARRRDSAGDGNRGREGPRADGNRSHGVSHARRGTWAARRDSWAGIGLGNVAGFAGEFAVCPPSAAESVPVVALATQTFASSEIRLPSAEAEAAISADQILF